MSFKITKKIRLNNKQAYEITVEEPVADPSQVNSMLDVIDMTAISIEVSENHPKLIELREQRKERIAEITGKGLAALEAGEKPTPGIDEIKDLFLQIMVMLREKRLVVKDDETPEEEKSPSTVQDAPNGTETGS